MPASAPSASRSTSRRSTDTITGDPVTDSPAQESGVIRTRPFPPLAKSYLEVSTIVRGEGLLARTPWFYTMVGAGLVLGLAGCITGFILLGDSWFQLLIATALGILLTQVACLAHEAAHRTVLSTGPANDRTPGAMSGSLPTTLGFPWCRECFESHHE